MIEPIECSWSASDEQLQPVIIGPLPCAVADEVVAQGEPVQEPIIVSSK